MIPVRAAGISQTDVVVDTCPHCCCLYLPTLLLPALAHTDVAGICPQCCRRYLPTVLLLPVLAHSVVVAGTCPHCYCCRHLPTLMLPVLAHTAVVASTCPHCCCCRHLPTLLPEFQLLSSLGPSVSKHFVLNRGTHGIRSGFIGSLQNREVCKI